MCSSDLENLRVKLTVRLIRSKHAVREEISGGLCLLGECHNVWWRRQVPVVVAPEFSSGTEALHFVSMLLKGR